MPENFKNFDYKYNLRNKSEIPENIHSGILNYCQQGLDDIYKTAENNSVPVEEVLGQNIKERINKMSLFIIEELRARGVEDVILSDIFFNKQKGLDFGKMGRNYVSHVEMFDVNIDDLDLKQLSVLKTLSHELYHSTGKLSVSANFKAKPDGKIGININTESSGAGYGEAIGNSALEEGSAVVFENKIIEKIKPLFPKDKVDLYNSLMDSGVKSFKRQGDEVAVESVFIAESTFAKGNTYGEHYNDAFLLVNYLANEIPEFYSKLEKLRTKREPLDLSRAVDSKFGEGTFRKLVTCKATDAEKLLEELQNN